MKGFQPSTAELAQISQWKRSLADYLSPAIEAESAGEIAKLLAAFPASATPSDSPVDWRMDAYFEALKDAPMWAITEARRRIIRGETELETRFAPTPPQFASVVKLLIGPVRRDIADLERIEIAATETKAIA